MSIEKLASDIFVRKLIDSEGVPYKRIEDIDIECLAKEAIHQAEIFYMAFNKHKQMVQISDHYAIPSYEYADSSGDLNTQLLNVLHENKVDGLNG